MTKEESNRKYRAKNRESINAAQREYDAANKEKISDYQRKWREAQKDGLFTVYLLPKENYVGQTTSFQKRLINHKSKNARDITNATIIGKYKTREEALVVEASYHAKGYLGQKLK
tara:strand:+ start:73 stop:417 length:345 start_codon:yes stop_codon:yes gene_type:complete